MGCDYALGNKGLWQYFFDSDCTLEAIREIAKKKQTNKQAKLGSKFRPNYIKVSGGGAQVSVHCEHLQVILMSIRGWEPSGHSGVSQKLLINKM